MAYPAIRSDLGALVRSDFIRLITRGGSSSDCLLALLRAPSDFGFRTLLRRNLSRGGAAVLGPDGQQQFHMARACVVLPADREGAVWHTR